MERFSKSGTPRSRQVNGTSTAVSARANSSNAIASLLIVTKPELARELRVSVRTIENMMSQRIIPFIRATKRSVRFYLPRVLAALEKREVKEVAK
jgi:hypothetical protein